MRRSFLAILCVALLIACGSATPTTTPAPTRAFTPTGTIVAPTATNAPFTPTSTEAATSPPTVPTPALISPIVGASVADRDGRCGFTLPFEAADGGDQVYTTSDGLIAFFILDTGGGTLSDAVAAARVTMAQGLSGYTEIRTEGSERAYRIDFSGVASDRSLRGMSYLWVDQATDTGACGFSLLMRDGTPYDLEAATRLSIGSVRLATATTQPIVEPTVPSVAPTVAPTPTPRFNFGAAPSASPTPTRIPDPYPPPGGGSAGSGGSGGGSTGCGSRGGPGGPRTASGKCPSWK